MTRRLLAVHAHPDDKSSKGAATYAAYAHAWPKDFRLVQSSVDSTLPEDYLFAGIDLISEVSP